MSRPLRGLWPAHLLLPSSHFIWSLLLSPVLQLRAPMCLPSKCCKAVRQGGSWAGGQGSKGWEEAVEWDDDSNLSPTSPQGALACLKPHHAEDLPHIPMGPSHNALQAKHPQHDCKASGSPGSPATKGELEALQGSLTREREEEDLEANLELGFPKPFQPLRLLAGSITAPASLSGYTMSFPWQGQRRGKNNSQKTRDM